ncbi:MAG: type II secretion system protein [Phycisphaeraceae bacterium JB051]
MKSHQTSRHAFTLIELLVVISIISLLIAILLPALQQARKVSRQTQCASMLRQIKIANIAYSNENDGYFPPVWHKIPGTSSYQAWIQNPLFRSMLGLDPQGGAAVPRSFICEESDLAIASNVGTMYNWGLSYGANYTGMASGADYVGWRELQIFKPSEKIDITDAVKFWTRVDHKLDYTGEDMTILGNTFAPAYRHLNDSMNTTYFDGHVANVTRDSDANGDSHWRPDQ